MAQYLIARADTAEREVEGHLDAWLRPGQWTDWVSAWLAHVLEERPGLITGVSAPAWRKTVESDAFGPLTRLSITRALARAKELDQPAWEALYDGASPAIRSEMAFSVEAEKDLYGWVEDSQRLLAAGEAGVGQGE